MTKKLQLEELGRVDLDTYRSQVKHPVRIILDDVRSAHNVGAVFRTADAFAIEHIHLCGITPVPPHHDITKTAIGATLSVEYSYHETVMDAIHTLRTQGYHIVGLEQTDHSSPLQQQIWQEPVAIVVGNEVNGVSDMAVPQIDTFVEIPQFGTKHSLNVSVATGIVLWDYMRWRMRK